MSIIRIYKQKNFSIISNHHLNDAKLSFKSKGILTYLLSKPDDWVVRTRQLARTSRDGRDAIYSGIKELVNAGYIIKQQVRNAAGQMAGLEYIVNENPVNKGLPPGPDNPYSENTELLNTDKRLKTENDVRSSLQGDKNTPPPPPTPAKDKKPIQSPPPGAHTAQTTDIEKAIIALSLLIPAEMRKPSVIAKIAQAVESGIKIELIQGCIAYSNEHSDKRTWQRYRSHLGRCIDGKWGAGYEPENKTVKEKEIIKARLELPPEALKALARAGDQYAIKALKKGE